MSPLARGESEAITALTEYQMSQKPEFTKDVLRVPQNLREQTYIATRWTLLNSAHLKTSLLSTWGQSIQSTQLRATQVWMTALQVTLLAASTLAQTASMAALSSWRRAFFSFALLDFLWMQAGGKQVWWKKGRSEKQTRYTFFIFNCSILDSIS